MGAETNDTAQLSSTGEAAQGGSFLQDERAAKAAARQARREARKLARKQVKAERPKIFKWRGLLSDMNRRERLMVFVAIVVAQASLSFTQLGFLGLGLPGEYVAYCVTLLVPVMVTGLLFGVPLGTLGGLTGGAILYIHAMLQPLDYYEVNFISIHSSIILFTFIGFVMAFLLALALRGKPRPVRRAIYIIIVSVVVSHLFSFVFLGLGLFRIFLFYVGLAAQNGLSDGEANEVFANVIIAGMQLGNVDLQIWVDAALMALACIALAIYIDHERAKQGDRSLRKTFRIGLFVGVSLVFMVTAAVGFIVITEQAKAQAKNDMDSEIVYLQGQLRSYENRMDNMRDFVQRDASSEKSIDEQEAADLNAIVSIDNLLEGYEKSADGTLVIYRDESVILSDDKNFKIGETWDKDFGTSGLDRQEAIDANELMQIVYDEVPRDEYMGLIDGEQPGDRGQSGETTESKGSGSATSGSATSNDAASGSAASNGAASGSATPEDAESGSANPNDASAGSDGENPVSADADDGSAVDQGLANASDASNDVESIFGRRISTEMAFMCVGGYKNYTIVVIKPAAMVFAGRTSVMLWTALSAFILLLAVYQIAARLLAQVVVRRIDETNAVLADITNGNLDARVDIRDSREFKSLSAGINTTVGALKESIAEAESRMAQELATAKAIQESALPRIFPPFPDIHRFDIYAAMKPAREVGGDFYDFFLIGDDAGAQSGKLGFVVADVSGKGVPAALFMMAAKTEVRNYLGSGMDPGEAIENANRQLCDGNDAGMFVTVFAGVLDYATGNVRYVNAGHNPPLLWQAGHWRWLRDVSGMPLGLFDGFPYDTYEVNVRVGDQFLLYTDGVTEAMNVAGELYGEERLEALVTENFTQHPRQLVGSLRLDLARYARGAEQSDDITMLALEYGVPPELTASLTVRADIDELPRVNDFIHTELDRRLCPLKVQKQLDIALEELFVNVARYAYPDAPPDRPGWVRVSYTYSAEPSVTVEIIDEGVPYNPLEKPDAVTPDDIMEVPIGGLGILMAKNSVDEMTYERRDGSNVVAFVKKW